MEYLNPAMLLYLTRLLDWDTYLSRRKGPDVDVRAEREALLEVVRTCASICADLEPAARAGWELEAALERGEVKLPPHMAQGYEKLREAGLVSFTIAEEYGGFALPKLVMNMAIQMIGRADASLMTVLGLQAGVANDIELYASEELKREYLPRFASGELWGAMDLTEPQAGSDLGAITTRAYDVNGQSLIEGQKIFITNGGAQVHLVLARDDASFDKSRGTTEGLSLFLVPRTLPDGKPNAVKVERLEGKLGLHGSPTCAIRLERAVGYRIAEKGRGFKAMLQLMNHARLGVAAQGIGISEAALHESLAYAAQRVQFGKPIGEQPLMKSMLARMVMATEGSRALLYRTCWLIDRNEATAAYLAREGASISEPERSALQAQMERDQACVRLLTPLAKYLATESCDQVTRMAIQIHGGLGFMKESAVGRLHLDGIITTIYEGTSEIQVSFALKEIGRGALDILFQELRGELAKHTSEPLRTLAASVEEGIERVTEASAALWRDINYALLCARPMGETVILLVVATELLSQAACDPERLHLAQGWIQRRMPELEMLANRIFHGGAERLEQCERIIALV
jgi:alkylation response protein AidB-like acyl-CoA dehydrogenase